MIVINSANLSRENRVTLGFTCHCSFSKKHFAKCILTLVRMSTIRSDENFRLLSISKYMSKSRVLVSCVFYFGFIWYRNEKFSLCCLNDNLCTVNSLLFMGLLSFFTWPLCCLSFFDLRSLFTPLVSSSSSSIVHK
jgi:hypothetical protein